MVASAGWATLDVIPSVKGIAKELEKQASAGLDAAGKRVGEDFGEAAADGAGSKFGGKFTDLAKKGALAAGGAAALAFGIGINGALDRGVQTDRLAASLGLSPAQQERLGAVAGRLYADAYGESFADVTNAVGAVKSSLKDIGSDRELEARTADVLNFASAFEVDVARAVQVAGTVMNSGLAKSSERALDLLTASSQKVPAALREDLLDASEEYGQFFATLGFTGEEAFATLVRGAEDGIYGIDKAGDAIKEFTIRSTDMSTASKDAYKAIGLDAEEMADKILKGGDTAQDATRKIINGLLDIESPSERANAAIALFGTPIEDLNVRKIPTFLKSLRGTSDELGKVRGSAERMGDALNDNAATSLTEFKRKAETYLVNFAEDTLIPLFEDEIVPALRDFSGWAEEEGIPAAKDLAEKIKPAADFAKDLAKWLAELPSEAKLVALAGVLGGGGYMKLRGGSGGALGGLGRMVGAAKPVPVFVTNPGFGAGGGGLGKGGAAAGGLRRLPPGTALIPIGLGSAPGQDSLMKKVTGTGLEGDKSNQLEIDQTWKVRIENDENSRRAMEALKETGVDLKDLRSDAALFGDELDLVGNKKVDPSLTIPNLPTAREQLSRFYDLEVQAGRPIEPNLRVLGFKPAMDKLYELQRVKIDDKTITIHTRYVDPGEVDYLSGGVRGARANGGGVRAREPYLVGERGPEIFRPEGAGAIVPNHELGRGAGVQVHIDQVVAQDYRDLTRQLQQRAQKAAIGGFGP